MVHPDEEKSSLNSIMKDKLETDWQTSTVREGFWEEGNHVQRYERLESSEKDKCLASRDNNCSDLPPLDTI